MRLVPVLSCGMVCSSAVEQTLIQPRAGESFLLKEDPGALGGGNGVR